MSEPHIVTQLPTPRTISDNSQGHKSNPHLHHSKYGEQTANHHVNPNWRLAAKNNLAHVSSNINTYYENNELDDNDNEQLPQNPVLKHAHTSSSALLGNAYNPSSMHNYRSRAQTAT